MFTTHSSVMLPITYIFTSLIVSVLKTIHAPSHHSPSVFPVVLFYVNALLLSISILMWKHLLTSYFLAQIRNVAPLWTLHS